MRLEADGSREVSGVLTNRISVCFSEAAYNKNIYLKILTLQYWKLTELNKDSTFEMD